MKKSIPPKSDALIPEWESWPSEFRKVLPGEAFFAWEGRMVVFDPEKLKKQTQTRQRRWYYEQLAKQLIRLNHKHSDLFLGHGVAYWTQQLANFPKHIRLWVFMREGHLVYRFLDMKTDSSFEIVPGFANKVISFRAAGKEILFCEKIEASGGMEWMYPFMDRVYLDEGGVRGSKFKFNGRLVEVEHEDLVRDGYIKKDGKTGITYHGMLRKKAWKVLDFGVDRQGVYMTSGLDTADYPPVCERFGRTRVVQTYQLLENELSIEETIQNLDDKDTLQGTGHHPWFAREGGTWFGMIPAESYSPMDERMLPTGKLLPVTNTPFDLRGTLRPLARDRHGVLTHLSRDWNGWAVSKMYNAADGTLIEYLQDQALPFCVIWDKEEKFFAFEGLSSNVNALTHVGDPAYAPVVLAPQERYTMRVKVRVSRKVDGNSQPLPLEQISLKNGGHFSVQAGDA